MNQEIIVSKDAAPSNESSDFSRINELDELVFLVLTFCTTEPQATNCAQLAAGMPETRTIRGLNVHAQKP